MSYTLAATQNLTVVVGAVLGVILFVVAIAFVLYRCRAPAKSSPSSEIEAGLTDPPSLEVSASDGAWNTLLGAETENPIAPTVDPFGYNSDEA
jgi:hypothetical protein